MAEEAAPAESQQVPTGGVPGSGPPEMEAGPSQPPGISGDVLLAQQLAAEMEKGSYAQASLCDFHDTSRIHEASWLLRLCGTCTFTRFTSG